MLFIVQYLMINIYVGAVYKPSEARLGVYTRRQIREGYNMVCHAGLGGEFHHTKSRREKNVVKLQLPLNVLRSLE